EVVQQLVDTGTAAASEKTIETTTVQEVIYCYVTADVTITGGEKTVETVLGRQTIYKSFRLRLKSGWNAIYHKEVHVAEGTITPVEKTRTVTLDVTNPDLYWVLP
ncbi:MAG: hypothetical protein LBH73_06610, partial [Spirochaetaceae bacterium]|nr:hypothetical protein [Spirochaetaceae bacterium]